MADGDFENQGPVFQISPAVRKQVPALICLWGLSDSGKTMSSLRLARGIVGPKGKIVLVDTENGRSLIYADKFGGWDHLDLQPPFTSERYCAALDSAIRSKANIVIFDSTSHVWTGEGGVLEQADQVTMQGLGKWKKPKMAYLRMCNTLFRAPVHIILCLRAKDKNVQVGKGKDAQIVNVGLVPLCDPGQSLVYECTIACHMEAGTRKPLAPIKAPEDIADVIRPGEFVTEEMGMKIAAWLAGGVAIDKDKEKLYREARDIATLGTARLKQHWDSLDQADKRKLKTLLDDLKSVASQADAEAAAQETLPLDADPLADEFTKPAELQRNAGMAA